jgi:hypothetical protein
VPKHRSPDLHKPPLRREAFMLRPNIHRWVSKGLYLQLKIASAPDRRFGFCRRRARLIYDEWGNRLLLSRGPGRNPPQKTPLWRVETLRTLHHPPRAETPAGVSREHGPARAGPAGTSRSLLCHVHLIVVSAADSRSSTTLHRRSNTASMPRTN